MGNVTRGGNLKHEVEKSDVGKLLQSHVKLLTNEGLSESTISQEGWIYYAHSKENH